MLHTDYLIVGAGLAGSALAFLLQKSGANVLLTELKDAEGKDKLCAGIMVLRAITHFQRIYGRESPEQLNLFPLHFLTKLFFGEEYTRPLEISTVVRKKLDDFCLKQYLELQGRLADRLRLIRIGAEEHIAEFRDMRENRTVQVSYGALIGADGAFSAVRRLMTGRRQHTVTVLQGTVDFLRSDVVMAFPPADIGYCWYIPRKEDATVGCGLSHLTVPKCMERLRAFCEDLHLEMPPLRGAPLPAGDDVLLQCGPDILLIGDAAGLCDAITGGGIHYALESALAVAEQLLKGIPYGESMASSLEELARSAHLAPCYSFMLSLKTARDISSGAKKPARQEEDPLIWVDRKDRETGSGPKLRTHEIGRLHRAFSVFILDPQQKRILLQKRAPGKYHSGGLWSNACCSHPRVGETTEEAVLKRLAAELGFTPDTEEKKSLAHCGSFIYRADFGALSEHEVDHVYTFLTDPDTFRMDAFAPEEIEALRWMSVSDMEERLAEHPEEFSAWFAPAWRLARASLSPAAD